MRRGPESHLQGAVVAFAAAAFKRGDDGAMVVKVRNEAATAGQRIVGALEGVWPGFPDLMVLHRGRVRFVELKTPKGRLSPAQEKTIEALRHMGFRVDVIRSLEAFEQLARREGWLRLNTRIGGE